MASARSVCQGFWEVGSAPRLPGVAGRSCRPSSARRHGQTLVTIVFSDIPGSFGQNQGVLRPRPLPVAALSSAPAARQSREPWPPCSSYYVNILFMLYTSMISNNKVDNFSGLPPHPVLGWKVEPGFECDPPTVGCRFASSLLAARCSGREGSARVMSPRAPACAS